MTRHRTLWTVIIDNSLLLVGGAVAGLAWANLAPLSYGRVAHALHFGVNDVGMVFFFALATKEIVEAALPGGPLASRREAAVPVLAAVGGMAAPAALYVLQANMAGRRELMAGWAIPCATDIAFSYLVARLIFPKRHPAIPFLLLLAIADDAFGLILLAVFYPAAPLSPITFVAFIVPAVAVGVWLKRMGILSFWPYVLIAGGLAWTGMFLGGIHPALALVPIVPIMPHARRDLGLLERREERLPDTMNRFEHWWRTPVQLILLLFGFVNAGVPLASAGEGTWMVLTSLVVGKPAGILVCVFLAVTAGLRPPGGLRYRDTAVVGVAAGIGFTVALFFATAAFPPGRALDEAKMGALLSFLAAPVAVLLGRAVGLRPWRP